MDEQAGRLTVREAIKDVEYKMMINQIALFSQLICARCPLHDLQAEYRVTQPFQSGAQRY